jgi:hypothetical protein
MKEVPRLPPHPTELGLGQMRVGKALNLAWPIFMLRKTRKTDNSMKYR